MRPLAHNELDWMRGSTDQNGKLFIHEGRICRAMYRGNPDYYARLVDTAAADDVLSGGLVSTTVSGLRVEDAAAVLEHERIPVFTKPYEWSHLMMRDAALAHIAIHSRLFLKGYNLQDAHPWNMTFSKTRPVYVDYGGIIKDSTGGLARRLASEYIRYMLYPLYLASRGEQDRVRRYMLYSNPPLRLKDLLGYLDIAGLPGLVRTRVSKRLKGERGIPEMLSAVKGFIEGLEFTPGRGRWDGYHDQEEARSEADWHDKQKNVAEILARLKPRGILDVGCATGWYTFLAARMGIPVIATDIDMNNIDIVYKTAADRGLPVTPAVCDIFQGGLSCRFNSDMVLALAIVHHLVFSTGMGFGDIARSLSENTGRWLLTEFISDGDAFVREHLGTSRWARGFYNLDNFTRSLEKYFSRIERLGSSSANRVLLLCTK